MKYTIFVIIALLLVPLAGYGSPQADRTAAVRKLLETQKPRSKPSPCFTTSSGQPSARF
jgi:hypothetical protein